MAKQKTSIGIIFSIFVIVAVICFIVNRTNNSTIGFALNREVEPVLELDLGAGILPQEQRERKLGKASKTPASKTPKAEASKTPKSRRLGKASKTPASKTPKAAEASKTPKSRRLGKASKTPASKTPKVESSSATKTPKGKRKRRLVPLNANSNLQFTLGDKPQINEKQHV